MDYSSDLQVTNTNIQPDKGTDWVVIEDIPVDLQVKLEVILYLFSFQLMKKYESCILNIVLAFSNIVGTDHQISQLHRSLASFLIYENIRHDIVLFSSEDMFL